MERVDITEGADPILALLMAVTAGLARYVFFPLATLRRRALTDADDADPTGRAYIPRPIQKALVFVLVGLCGVGVGLLAGKPLVYSVSAALVGTLPAMALFDAQYKR